MIPLTCVAQGTSGTGKVLGSDDEMRGVPPVHTARAEVIWSPLALRAFLESRGGSKSRKFARKGPDQRFCFR